MAVITFAVGSLLGFTARQRGASSRFQWCGHASNWLVRRWSSDLPMRSSAIRRRCERVVLMTSPDAVGQPAGDPQVVGALLRDERRRRL